MERLFLSILDMSWTASYVIAAVLVFRLLLRRAPKKWSYALWSVVAFRLCCPISFQSIFSLFNLRPGPSSAAQSGGITGELMALLLEYAGASFTQNAAGGSAAHIASVPLSPEAAAAPPSTDWLSVAVTLWMLGMAALLLVNMVSYIRLRRSIASAMILEGNIYQSDQVRSPFILGFIHPRIFIPFRLNAATQRYVLAHERYHIRRLDHIIKPFAFLLLTIHWFNPLCWLAFHLMTRDMEMSCDEKVLSAGQNIRRAYSTSLLSFAANHRFPSSSPLAFSESDAKRRIKNVLSWKKPKTWATVTAAILCTIAVIVCAADPVATENRSATLKNNNAEKPLFSSESIPLDNYIRSKINALDPITYYTADGKECSAPVSDTKRRWLTKLGSVTGVSPGHTLEIWDYQYEIRLDTDTDIHNVLDEWYENDGWYCLKQSDGYLVVARGLDDSVDVLEDIPSDDVGVLTGGYADHSGRLYDWYTRENGLTDLPTYHKTDGTTETTIYDGDGWYIYMPESGWDIIGPRQWTSSKGTDSTFSIHKMDTSAQDQIDTMLADGWEIAESPTRMVSPEGNTQDYYYDDPAGGCFRVRIHWNRSSPAEVLYDELACMQAMAQSFVAAPGFSGDTFRQIFDELIVSFPV